ncbi:hypothetical protein B0J12DRAFT_731309 [Macrophomina phaseolina]|uniref:Acyl-protein thioesterase 1 n=1 Tax=Macrophomina phaseolina TaxID=35725 RepID=A0ABQ8G0H6_9PEZI|nr:hypothetical protein B0J12DRAFT_731309 [Macrophomina phaseolina]
MDLVTMLQALKVWPTLRIRKRPLTRIFPNALDNRDAMQRTWYKPTPLSPFPSQRPELDDPEDEDGLKQSVAYMETPIDDLVGNGFPPNRIVIGGYSQDCVVSLLTGLISNKYAGKVAGVAGLLGCIPLPRSDLEAKEASKDMLVPKTYLNSAQITLADLGLDGTALEVHEYDGLGPYDPCSTNTGFVCMVGKDSACHGRGVTVLETCEGRHRLGHENLQHGDTL